MKTLKGFKIWELIAFLEEQDENDEILLYSYDSCAGKITYKYPCFSSESISRTDSNIPIECKEGDGGNESAVIISAFN